MRFTVTLNNDLSGEQRTARKVQVNVDRKEMARRIVHEPWNTMEALAIEHAIRREYGAKARWCFSGDANNVGRAHVNQKIRTPYGWRAEPLHITGLVRADAVRGWGK